MAKKRRTFSAEFKVDAVMDLLTGAKTPAEICRERNITDKLLYRWKNELMERLPGVFERGQGETTEAEQRIAEAAQSDPARGRVGWPRPARYELAGTLPRWGDCRSLPDRLRGRTSHLPVWPCQHPMAPDT